MISSANRSVLFTGDWQLEVANLHKAQDMLDEIFDVIRKNKVDTMVHLGDLKRAYNPVDVRVSNFAVKAYSKLCKEVRLLHLNGNHDRIGMYTDTLNWSPILKDAGAVTFDRAGWDGDIAMLPFCSSVRQFKKYSARLAAEAKARKRPSLLAFHQDVKHCQYSVLVKSEDAKTRVRDLHPSRYAFCVGGHIHLQQCVKDNVWFCGSPFPMDWGEANQRKGFILVQGFKELTQIESKLPRMYDTKWPRFEESKPKSWKGAVVRIHVSVPDNHNMQKILHKAEEKAEKKYKGASVLAVPEITQAEAWKAETIRVEDSDTKKLKLYVNQTLPKKLKDDKDRVIAYLEHQLKSVSQSKRAEGKFIFDKAKAKNFLGFKELEVSYAKGLTVITGVNKDWPERSNGVGKTSLLQIPAVAIVGKTFKGQKFNKWSRRGSKEEAYVKLYGRTQDGRKATITRGRHPSVLKLKIDGKDMSSGNSPSQLQSEIEELTGYTEETLGSSVYVDQDKSNALLSGSEADRQAILGKIQNSERFKAACEKVKDDLKTLVNHNQELNSSFDLLNERIQTLKLTTNLDDATSSEREVKSITRKLEDLNKKKSKLKPVKHYHKRAQELNLKIVEVDSVIAKAAGLRGKYDSERERAYKTANNLKSLKSTCPTCKQPVKSKELKPLILFYEGEVSRMDSDLKKLDDIEDKAQEKSEKYNALADVLDEEKRHYNSDLESLDNEIKNYTARLTELVIRSKKIQKAKKTQAHKLTKARASRAVVYRALKSIRTDTRFLMYCAEALSRTGLPSFLNLQLVPQLNKSTADYAELFSDNEIQVQFVVDEKGNLKPNIVNAHGGEFLEDQSKGEKKLASLITALACWDLTPSNLLILDEPGDGLDAANSRIFAKGLRKISNRFGTVLLTTHNQVMQAELQQERHIEVVKSKGISKAYVR